jgi:hypothetical protein
MFDVDGHHTNKVWMTSCLDSSARLDSDSGDKSRSLSVAADPRACLGLLCSKFYSSALAFSNQTPPTPKTLLDKKGGVQGQLHVFPRAPQGVL